MELLVTCQMRARASATSAMMLGIAGVSASACLANAQAEVIRNF
jgi:hypothetical protein